MPWRPWLRLQRRAFGTAYLVWLAWRIAGSGSPREVAKQATPIGFLGGAVLLLYNPKGWAMTTGAAASFSTVSAHPGMLAALFGTTFAAALSLTVWCLLGVVLSRLLATERQWTVFNIAMAVLLIASIVLIWTHI